MRSTIKTIAFHLLNTVALALAIVLAYFLVRDIAQDTEWTTNKEHVMLQFIFAIAIVSAVMFGYRLVASIFMKEPVALPLPVWNSLVFLGLSALFLAMRHYSEEGSLVYLGSLLVCACGNQIIPEDMWRRFRPAISWVWLGSVFIVHQILMEGNSAPSDQLVKFLYPEYSLFPAAMLLVTSVYFQFHLHRYEKPLHLVAHCLFAKYVLAIGIAVLVGLLVPHWEVLSKAVGDPLYMYHFGCFIVMMAVLIYEWMGPKVMMVNADALGDGATLALTSIPVVLLVTISVGSLTGKYSALFIVGSVFLALGVLLLYSDPIMESAKSLMITKWSLRCLPLVVIATLVGVGADLPHWLYVFSVFLCGISVMAWVKCSQKTMRVGGAFFGLCVLVVGFLEKA